MSEEIKKESFFKKILKSIKDFDKYEDFALEKKGEAFKYLLKIIVLFSAIISIFYTYKILNNMNKLYIQIKDKIPEFSYENGELTTDTKEPTIIEDYAPIIGTMIIDTQIDDSNVYDKYYQNNIEKYGTGYVFTKDKLIVYNPQINGQASFDYEEILLNYNISKINKQELINNIDNINIVAISLSIYFMILIYVIILYFISILIDVIILSLLGYLISRFSRIRLKFAPCFNIAAHAITLPIILNMVYIIINLFTNFEIKYFELMYNTISYIYVVVAILMIKTDFLNRQAELIQIAQEQLKIKNELQQQEEKKKDEEKEKTDDKNKESEPKEEKKEKDNSKNKKKKEKSTDEPIGDVSSSDTMAQQ